MTDKALLPCAICGMELENAIPSDVAGGGPNQPHKGLAFTTGGHYGSTLFDPMVVNNPYHLEINICDSCVSGLQKKGHILFGTSRRTIETELVQWDGIAPDFEDKTLPDEAGGTAETPE